MWKLKIAVCLFAAFAGADNIEEEWLDYSPDDALYNAPAAPYMAVIFKNNRPTCSGALVSETPKSAFVVTAAHCVSGPTAQLLQIQLGSAVLEKPTSINKIIIHPYYRPPSSDYDVAILKIHKAATESETQNKPIELSTVQPLSKDSIIINGWDLKGGNKTLLNLNATVENKSMCKKRLEGHMVITSKMICANVKNEYQNFIIGGSPLVFNNTLAGVATSAFHKSPTGLYTRIYTNIANSEISDFLTQIV